MFNIIVTRTLNVGCLGGLIKSRNENMDNFSVALGFI